MGEAEQAGLGSALWQEGCPWVSGPRQSLEQLMQGTGGLEHGVLEA